MYNWVDVLMNMLVMGHDLQTVNGKKSTSPVVNFHICMNKPVFSPFNSSHQSVVD